MIPQWIIEQKRDGAELAAADIREFINGYARGDIPDYQMSALAMAIYFQGMTPAETAVLTDAMMRSGEIVDSSSIALPKVDKHSTGGIGDKVSLILAPLAACCGVAVPMISGRGLGITGGTLDKMESISGYRADLSEEEFVEVVRDCGCSIIGQTERLAPADKKLYALRDVSGTVPSIPLITASIMCKKMAEGIDALVLDVKFGSGAFMKTIEQARELAWSMVDVGRDMGREVVALLTTMDEPLGCDIGNALEVRESIECLRGGGASDLMEVTLALAEQMLLVCGVAEDPDAARSKLQDALDSGQALAKFRRMVELQGGDAGVVDEPERLPRAEIVKEFRAGEAGYVAAVDAEAVGKAVLVLGGGRVRTDDRIDPAVGISKLAKIGQEVSTGDPLAEIHASDEDRLAEAEALLKEAFTISMEALEAPARIVETVR
jgi:pyrimidine-nucleoside phosphorylase